MGGGLGMRSPSREERGRSERGRSLAVGGIVGGMEAEGGGPDSGGGGAGSVAGPPGSCIVASRLGSGGGTRRTALGGGSDELCDGGGGGIARVEVGATGTRRLAGAGREGGGAGSGRSRALGGGGIIEPPAMLRPALTTELVGSGGGPEGLAGAALCGADAGPAVGAEGGGADGRGGARRSAPGPLGRGTLFGASSVFSVRSKASAAPNSSALDISTVFDSERAALLILV